jgi:phospholipid N-methyltransferase
MKAKSLIYIFFPIGIVLALLALAYSGTDFTLLALRQKNADAIGAIAESSNQLADVITGIIEDSEDKKYILEAGGGTGIFTEKIIKKLRPGDHLDVVEFMPELCEILNKKFANTASPVTIHCMDILDIKPEKSYTHIISGLPFNSFAAEFVQKITDKYVEFAVKGAPCSFFEYKWLPTLRPLFMNQQEKDQYRDTREVIENFVKRYEKSSTAVYANIPPAIVHFLQLNN